ncbi:LPS export ABC transporter periplasmic protein LptC [Rhizobiaceae bacterium n13]|uniref:LPS export ABC transporter periplasmic protein LptC n=1 Tax=Ferirhizobium litorale TaxID=2927786 RepID=A0AAE3QHA5_9HYPH|nr:LPS export ABC transporter periplasmic protein LptC [Fererhizobium litorale]MDI7864743.1 LPS export ABC transporter periplasmic protein LptC [Fererhizobium litorale]MDI7924976.1 LPS export ABC transporter periplasmic protein LptC [Fererhizobium litorale]
MDNALSHARTTNGASLDADGAYRAAIAHSSQVRRLKVLLPILAVIISLIFIGVSVVRTYLLENVTIESARIENGKIVMEKPAISGRNADGIEYSMMAARALQDIRNPNLITLEDIKAAVPVSDDVIARVVAVGGLFDKSTDQLDMTAPFTITLNSGIEAKFQSAHLDVKAGKLVSDDPVSIVANEGSILAQTLKMTDKGRTIIFEGKVRVNVDPAAIRNKSN